MELTCPLCGPKQFDASNCPYGDGEPACPTCKRTRVEAELWRDLKPLPPQERPSKVSSSPFPFTTGDRVVVSYRGGDKTRFPTRLRVWIGNDATDFVVRAPVDGSNVVALPPVEIPAGARTVSYQDMSGQAAPHWYSIAKDGAEARPRDTGFTASQELPKQPEPAWQPPAELSPQCMAIIANWILYSYRFGMQEELRQEGPVVGLVKLLPDLVAGWFGRVPEWKHCDDQLQRALSAEQLTIVRSELHFLEIEWRSFIGPISVFSDSPTHDPGWRLAHKIKSLRASTEYRIKCYNDGLIRPGQSGESFRWYRDHRVTTLTPTVWRAFAMALERLEGMRLARPGAKPWAET
jgi:hypothetical protein